MPSFPGPYQVEINYSIPARSHKMRIDCQVVGSPVPGTSPSQIDVQVANGTTKPLDQAVDELIALLQPICSNTMTFNDFTLWKFTANTYQRQFVTTEPLGVLGTATAGANPAHYRIWTMRTIGGGIAKLTLLEDTNTSNDQVPYASLDVNSKALVDYLIGNTGWLYARDNTYPIAALYESRGQNEAIWRKIYRQ